MITRHGFIKLPQCLERSAKIGMRLGEIGRKGEDPADETNGNVVFSHLMGDHTKQM